MVDQKVIGVVAASSYSPSVVSSKRYDVFLSFRGEDTRKKFTSHLYDALKQKKVETFIDNRLEKGEEISTTLIQVIEDSHISIVIFSENYASSKWCLGELSKIMECKKEKGQIVIPVFYDIDPSHVRKQTGSYEKLFVTHKGEPMCNKWKAALTEAANLAAWDSQTYRVESELLKDIVEDVLQKLAPIYPNCHKGLVGIEENYEKIESLLKVGSNEVKILGIWGMGGIGKTTLARALYDKLSHEFEGHCFLENVREESDKHGVKALRNKLFSELLGNKNHCFDVAFSVTKFVLSRLGRKKVFIVLDDVATSEQLENLIEDFDFMGLGSRVVVTSRNKQIFSQDKIYEVKELSFHHSLQLFSLTVFREKQPKYGYEDLSRSATYYCKGVPLALKVLGATLRSRSKGAWECELRKLQKFPNMKIHSVLKLSYDGLDHTQKDIFLDIACFFRGNQRDHVTNMLEAFDFSAISGIEALLDRALITVSGCNQLEMHDLIQEMGWEIVHQECVKDPGRRSRLWKHEEVHEVFKYNKGTDIVEGIILDLSKLIEDLYLSSDFLAKMTNVRFFKIHSWSKFNIFNVYLPNGLNTLSHKMRYLHWDGFCLESLPANFCAEKLVELCMRCSKLKKLWDGVQNLVNLKTIDLWGSRDLIEIPDLSLAEKLENVSLCYCESLREVHVHSKSLRVLNLYGCSSLRKFSVTSEELTRLSLAFTSICSIPTSIWHKRKLKALYLTGCRNLGKLTEEPRIHGSHKHSLTALASNAERFSMNIKSLSTLRMLWLDDCKKLVSLPKLPPSLGKLSASNCTSLDSYMTQRLVLQHMLQSRIPYLRTNDLRCYDEEYLFPGNHVIEECVFNTTETSMTIPYLWKTELYGFIYCIILSKGSLLQSDVSCSVYQDGIRVGWLQRLLEYESLTSNHVLCMYHDINEFDAINEEGHGHFFSNVTFIFENSKASIEEFGVFPIYGSESGLKLVGSR
ncbi:TMV resistance protein N isoform X1 [Vigna radiata var. radiata]|uniref:TMV resistance protein N isoform X1 n=2 Tax=Vigna radiata var. radiata TaxID=3916 RepID=A0A1S3VLC1_VIGRR|nr:TMV resistance protein N isoform X1 [Vigna radiata var. radiata]XP_022642778.1 TMV resistance protein N isoform X1 [Vigna radiata var. radiata]XP_022642779.1 TMV resistance protein N isoform X1 [Vigna radiata var. radiata]